MEKDNLDDKTFTLAAALTTVIFKIFGLRGTQFNSFLDRCPTFISKEKSLKAKLIGKCRKVICFLFQICIKLICKN